MPEERLTAEEREMISRATMVAVLGIVLMGAAINGQPQDITDALRQINDMMRALYPESPRQGLNDICDIARYFGVAFEIPIATNRGKQYVH